MRKRFLVLLVLLALLVGAYLGGAFERVSDAAQLRALLTQSGAWGPLVFVLVFAVLEGLGAPGFLFILTATRVWPFWEAFVLMLLGAVGAAVVGFAAARSLGRDLLEKYLPESARRYDDQLAARTFHAVFVIRIVFFIAPWTHWMLGLSRVRFVPFLAATILGLLPGMLLATYAGGNGLDWLMRQETEVVVGTAMFFAAVIGGALWWRRHQRAPGLASADGS